MKTKKCTKCLKVKNTDQFNLANKEKGYLQPKCKKCHSLYLKQHYANNKEYYKNKANVETKLVIERNRKFIINAKNVPCKDCGKSYPPYVMDFDHVTNDKVKNIGNMLVNSMETLSKEIKKCEVVCANCHRERTYGKNNNEHS